MESSYLHLIYDKFVASQVQAPSNYADSNLMRPNMFYKRIPII